MKAQKKSSFKGKVGEDSKRQSSGANYGYLKLPKGVSVFNPEPDSKISLDFMPYTVTDLRHPDRNEKLEIAVPDTLWYKRPFKIHRSVGSGNDSVVCLTSIGKKCPICEYREKAAQEGTLGEKELKDLKPSKRNLYVVIPLDAKKLEVKPHILDVSQFLFQDLLNKELEENDGYEVFPDIEEGLTLRVRFDEETFLKNKYAKASRIDFLERKKPYKESILEDIPDLDKVLTILSYEDLRIKFLELEEVNEDNDEPKRSKKSSSKEEEEELPTWEELEEMSWKKLCRLIRTRDLKIEDFDDFDENENEDGLREAIAELLEIEKPGKKQSKKAEEKPVMQRKNRNPEPDPEPEEEPEEDESVREQIENADSLDDLITIARDNPEVFKSSIKDLMKIKKMGALAKEMLEIYDESQEPDDDAEEPDEDEMTWKDLEQLNLSLLLKLIKSKKLGVDGSDYEDDVKALRRAIAVDMDIKIPKTVPTPKEIAKEDRCVACKGSGKNSKGGVCVACGGTGVKQVRANEGPTGQCPSGYKFGIDTDTKKECDTCKKWDACIAEQEKKAKK